jgi:oligopeptide/dipeptide ABC transporter ATP-binding protein
MGAPLLSFEGFTLELATASGWLRVLDGIDLRVGEGESLALVGESGSGKTLCAQSVTRLLPPHRARCTSGAVRLSGVDVFKASERDLRRLRGAVAGHVFQEPAAALNPAMRIGDQVLEALRLHRPAEARHAEAVRWLARVGIPAPEDRARQFPHELSGGLQQRVTLAIALAPRPRLLVADEPTTALDVTVQAQVLELLAQARAELGMAILLVTHNLGVVEGIADRVAVLYAGQVVEHGPTADVLARPLHPYTRALVASVPRLGQATDRLGSLPGSVPAPGAWPTGCRFQPRCPQARASCGEASPPWNPARLAHGARCPFATEEAAT